MRVELLGSGIPEVAIVGAVHGDEPCGAHAIERLLKEDPRVDRPAKLIIANEVALARGVRFVDADLNRAFAEDADPDSHEYRLARRLADELRGLTVLILHSTRSHPKPFGIVNGSGGPAESIAPKLSITALVKVVRDEGRLFAMDADLLEVEAGLQGTQSASKNATRIAREFLVATNVLPGRVVERELPVYRLGRPIPKPAAKSYEVFVDNFTLVEAGEPYAAADGEPMIAEESFYPVLLSADGYAEQFGYQATHIGTLPRSGAASDS